MARIRIQSATPSAPSPAPPALAPRRRILVPPPAPALLLPSDNQRFISSGSTLLDLVLGGGWALGRVANIVGDKSSGKTLLAVELTANFANSFGAENTRYAEAEAAFSEAYAQSIGMPVGTKLLSGEERLETVEEWEADLLQFLEARKAGDGPCLYVLDSLDALSDTAEMEREEGKGSYGAAKAKKLSEMFRKRIGLIADRQCLLFVVSQIRDKLNVTFGETKTRSGGKALDFYASQIVWLAELGKIKRTVLGIDRIIGCNVQARAKKNKVGMPYRDAEMQVLFSYGVDDESSMLQWLVKHKADKLLALTKEEAKKAIETARKERDLEGLEMIREDLKGAVRQHWERVEDALAPTMSKYGSRE